MSDNWLRGKAALVGFGHTPYYRRGQYSGGPQGHTTMPLVVEAVMKACDDAGISPRDIDGYASYSNDGADPGTLAMTFGAPKFRFSSMTWGGGGGPMCGAYLHAAMAVATGQANYVCVVRGIMQPPAGRFGGSGRKVTIAYPHVLTPAQNFAQAATRHMHKYGTTIEHFGEVAISNRLMASNNPDARFRMPITMEDHHNSRPICEPLRLLDICLEAEGGCAVIVTSTERAKDLRQKPVMLTAAAMGAPRRWGAGLFGGLNMADEDFASAGQKQIADDLYGKAGLGPNDIDVAQIYDHFTPMVLMGLEDFGFCAKGESGPFVADGNIRLGGAIPTNTHGGNLSEVYLHGMTHVFEAMRQIRGTSHNQVPNAETCLVVGGSSPAPSSAMIVTA